MTSHRKSASLAWPPALLGAAVLCAGCRQSTHYLEDLPGHTWLALSLGCGLGLTMSGLARGCQHRNWPSALWGGLAGLVALVGARPAWAICPPCWEEVALALVVGGLIGVRYARLLGWLVGQVPGPRGLSPLVLVVCAWPLVLAVSVPPRPSSTHRMRPGPKDCVHDGSRC